MIDTKERISMMTRLQEAKIKISPVVEEIIKTTIIYSENEFKKKLRNNEAIFCIEKIELLRALEASRLLFEVKNALNLNLPTFEYCHSSVTNYSINSIEYEAETDKSIASSMKKIIVNTLTVHTQDLAKSNKVSLDQVMIQHLMKLHKDIIETMDKLQDTQLQKKINPLLKNLDALQDMSSGEKTNRKQKKISASMKLKKNMTKTSAKKPKKRKLIILSPERDKLNIYHPLEMDRQQTSDRQIIVQEDSPPQKDILTRKSTEFDDFIKFGYSRTINLDIGQIEYNTNSIDATKEDKNMEFPDKIDNTKNDEAIGSDVKIPDTEINENIRKEFPKPHLEPLPKRILSLIKQEEKIESISEAKRILVICLDKLTYIRNYLNATLESNKTFDNKASKIDIPEKQAIIIDASTAILELDRKESEDVQPCEFNQLLRNVLDQINSMEKMVNERQDVETKKKENFCKDIVQNEVFLTPSPPQSQHLIHDITDKRQTNSNHIFETKFEHRKHLTDIPKLQTAELNQVGKLDICPPRITHVESVFKILCAQELHHPDPHVNVLLNKIGLENLINSAEPAKCSKLVIVNDPRDLPELPFKPSLCSLPLSQSDLTIVQSNVDHMEKR